jgi:hypothetical protein
MTATKYMTAAIAHAEERRQALEAEWGKPCNGASGWVETPVGELKVSMVRAEGRTTHMAPIYRKTWTLAGRRIAAAKIGDAIYSD